MGKIRVTIEIDDNEPSVSGGLPKIPEVQKITRYGAEFEGTTSEYTISEALIDTIDRHRTGTPAFSKIENFN